MKNASIEDVAALAKVSISTVSRVINNTPYPISDEKRKAVLKAVKELSYTPNSAAQHLGKRYTKLIGLIVRDISDFYFGEIAKGVSEQASKLGYATFICNTGRSSENELVFHDLLWQHRVRGIILAGGGFSTKEYREILEKQKRRREEFGLRTISLAPQGIDLPSVMIDNVDVMKKLVDYLVSKGHRKIALISGAKNNFTVRDHVEGYQKSLSEHGIKIDSDLISYSDFTEHGGYNGCIELLKKSEDFTAICAGSDTLAAGILHALHENHKRVPEDISIAGIGDFNYTQYLRPPLTSIRVPRYEMGARAVDIIAREEEHSVEDKILYTPKMVERESVKKIN